MSLLRESFIEFAGSYGRRNVHPQRADYLRRTQVERHIDDALQDMIKGGVRTLLVLDEGHVVGPITAYDIQGERPLQFLQSSDCVHES